MAGSFRPPLWDIPLSGETLQAQIRVSKLAFISLKVSFSRSCITRKQIGEILGFKRNIGRLGVGLLIVLFEYLTQSTR
jgi:hypothetical protein